MDASPLSTASMVLILNHLQRWEESKRWFPVLQIRKQRLKKMKQLPDIVLVCAELRSEFRSSRGPGLFPSPYRPVVGGDEASQSDDGVRAGSVAL